MKVLEEWKDIEGFEGSYQVSNYGRVRSLDRYRTNGYAIILYKGKILTPFMAGGYYEIGLNCGHKKERKVFLVHRLVAQAFIPNPDNLPEVNHKDENKLNNCVWNLEWISSRNNANYGTRNERAIESKKNAGLLRSVYMLDMENNILNEFHSLSAAAEYVNGKRGNIWAVCNNKKRHKTAYGYKWQYKSNFQS